MSRMEIVWRKLLHNTPESFHFHLTLTSSVFPLLNTCASSAGCRRVWQSRQCGYLPGSDKGSHWDWHWGGRPQTHLDGGLRECEFSFFFSFLFFSESLKASPHTNLCQLFIYFFSHFSVWLMEHWNALGPSMPMHCRCSQVRKVSGLEQPTLRRTMAPGNHLVFVCLFLVSPSVAVRVVKCCLLYYPHIFICLILSISLDVHCV